MIPTTATAWGHLEMFWQRESTRVGRNQMYDIRCKPRNELHIRLVMKQDVNHACLWYWNSRPEGDDWDETLKLAMSHRWTSITRRCLWEAHELPRSPSIIQYEYKTAATHRDRSKITTWLGFFFQVVKKRPKLTRRDLLLADHDRCYHAECFIS